MRAYPGVSALIFAPKIPLGIGEAPPCTGIGAKVHGSCRRRSLGVSCAAAPRADQSCSERAKSKSSSREICAHLNRLHLRIVATTAHPGNGSQPTFPRNRNLTTIELAGNAIRVQTYIARQATCIGVTPPTLTYHNVQSPAAASLAFQALGLGWCDAASDRPRRDHGSKGYGARIGNDIAADCGQRNVQRRPVIPSHQRVDDPPARRGRRPVHAGPPGDRSDPRA
jgi:hypothetical protein